MSKINYVLVTGAAGFIASKTCEILITQGYHVIGVDNLNDYYSIELKNHRLNQLKRLPNFSFYKIDIENFNELEELFNKYNFSAVVNLAARAGVRYSMENPYVYLSTNTLGTLNLLELMRKHNIKKIILASTSSLYAGQKMPFNESLAVNNPISPYAATKKAAELLCHSYHKLYNFDVSIVRYFTVYGPAGRPDMSIFRFIKWIDNGSPIEIFGDGNQSRDFTYVEDIARGTVLALKNVGYEIINLGGGKNPVTLLDIIGRLEKMMGKKANIKNLDRHIADIEETWADIQKAKDLLGWEPSIDLNTGLTNCVDWYYKEIELCNGITL
jgi:UDP-glucuronate 4-epimerase